MTFEDEDSQVRTPGRGYFDAKTATDRFEAPRASLIYDKHGRAIYGLPEAQSKVHYREHFERIKHEENMKKQEADLRPNEGKQRLRQIYEENLRLEAEKLERKQQQARGSRVGTNHHLYRMSDDNPMRIRNQDSDDSDSEQPVPVRPSRAPVAVAHCNVFKESTTGPTIFGVVDNRKERSIEMRRDEALRSHQALKKQIEEAESIFSKNPHGFTPAQRRQLQEQGLEVGSVGFGEEISAPMAQRRVLR